MRLQFFRMLQPNQIVEYAAKSAKLKGEYGFRKVIILSFLAGVYISMAGLIAIIAGYGMPSITDGNPGLVKLLMGATFPVGLMLVVLAGGELFTGNTAYFIPSVMNGEQPLKNMFRNWALVWCGNFIGALFFGYFLVHLTHVVDGEVWNNGFAKIAHSKTSYPFYVTMLKGVGANWLVCLAMWLAMASKNVTGKIIGMWWPVMVFVAIGYEHSIANMFFLPMAMFKGVTDITIIDLFVKNLIPATVGNIIGGSIFVAMAYWYSLQKLSPKK